MGTLPTPTILHGAFTRYAPMTVPQERPATPDDTRLVLLEGLRTQLRQATEALLRGRYGINQHYQKDEIRVLSGYDRENYEMLLQFVPTDGENADIGRIVETLNLFMAHLTHASDDAVINTQFSEEDALFTVSAQESDLFVALRAMMQKYSPDNDLAKAHLNSAEAIIARGAISQHCRIGRDLH